jgi:Rrf2 family protein
MRLSRDTRYAIEALSALAERPLGEVVDARELARDAGLPASYLAKIMQSIARAGVVDSFRGRGYALPRSPKSITIRDVIAAVDGDDAFWEGCIFWREECSEADPCPLHFRWRSMRPAFNAGIGELTLADIGSAGRVRPGRTE